ncbi:MAG: hypothetical protein IIA45_11640 [Bacteroidetes bacterium]|nr:hypothetical protein [Bacteroidota bacterium]
MERTTLYKFIETIDKRIDSLSGNTPDYEFIKVFKLFIKDYKSKIDDYYPHEEIDSAINTITKDEKVIYVESGWIHCTLEMTATIKILCEIIHENFKTSYKKREINTLLKGFLTASEELASYKSNSNLNDSPESIVQNFQNNLRTVYRSQNLMDKLQSSINEYFQEIEKQEKELKNILIYMEMDKTELEKQLEEILYFDYRWFEKKLLPDLYGAIFLNEKESKRHKRIMLYNIFKATHPGKCISQSVWNNLNKSETRTYSQYKDDTMRSIIGS